MKSTMPHSVIVQLIEQVKNRPFIWNTRHEMYNDRYLVATGWKEIQDELQQPELVLRLKWRNIRDVFKKEIKRHPCDNPEEYTGKWQYFEAVFFIHAETQACENDDSVSEQDIVSEDYQEEEYSFDNQKRLANPELTEIKIEYNGDETDCDTFLNTNTEDQLPEKRPRKQSPDNDYDLMFLKSLVPYFSHLDPMRKLVLRSKLQDILLKELAEQEQCNAVKTFKET